MHEQAGQHVKDTLKREAVGLAGQLRRAVSLGNLGGFSVTAYVHRSLGTTKIAISLEGAPGTTIDLPASGLRGADPAGLVYLDQARQLIDQAAALDPSRTGQRQQHREQIAARQLILDARAAHAAGHQQRADKLLGDAHQLDPACQPSGTATWTPPCLPGQPPAAPRTKPRPQTRATPHGKRGWHLTSRRPRRRPPSQRPGTITPDR